MSRKTSSVAGGDTGLTSQYNFVRDEATASSWLLAYGDTTTNTLKVLVNAGLAYFGGTKVEFTGGYSPAMTAPAASSRIDVVSMSSTPEIVITVGTEADSPTAPTPPTGDIPICEVYNRAGEVKITDTDEGAGEGYINKDLRTFVKYGQVDNYSDVIASRAVDTDYQNTTGKWMMVIIEGEVSSATSGWNATLAGLIGSGSPPTSAIARIWIAGQGDGGTAISHAGTMTFLVPPSWYYRVTRTIGAGCTGTLFHWWEGKMVY